MDCFAQCTSANHSKEKFAVARLAALFLLAVQLLGCGGKSGGPETSAPGTAPAIVVQPADQSVPMSFSATYTVNTTGSSLQYQWSKNGSPIAGATSASYTTPATAFSDTGSVFTVTISNSVGTVTSNQASLTVTARAPAAGDLRFQQVDAASTVNGYDNGPTGFTSYISAGMGASFSPSIGSQLFLSPMDCTVPAPVQDPRLGCTWRFEQFYLTAGPNMSTGYGADYLTNLQVDLQSSTFPAAGNALNAPNSVITSLDLVPADNLFAASWIQTSQTGGFDMSQQTVASTDFQAAAMQEGAHSRVITAVSYNAGQVVYLSYGWQSDTTTVYETQVATASVETASVAAANLAAQGYILTAIGGSDVDDSYILVGTRVQGDTMPRPFVSYHGLSGIQIYATLMQPGYAMVGALQDTQGNLIYLGER